MKSFFANLLRTIMLLLIVGAGATVFVFWQGKEYISTPMEVNGQDVQLDILPGASFQDVTDLLIEKGLISDAFKFKIFARLEEVDNKLQAGRFILNTGWTPAEILEHLVYGKAMLDRITIREGLTWWETGQLLEEEGFLKFEDFKAVIMDDEFLRHYGIPFDTAEGFLMPDTYLIEKEEEPNRDTAWSIAGRLVDTFWLKMEPYWINGQKPNAEELRELVILASIVERETGIAAERQRVAGVYANRLRIGMPLQADPTIIYGLGEAFDGNLRRTHINDANNLYNTYQHGGLTPGPICSPGVAAMRAALDPEEHEFLYFVAITDGGEHKFSRTLSEHNRAVQEYLRNR